MGLIRLLNLNRLGANGNRSQNPVKASILKQVVAIRKDGGAVVVDEG